jgi:hypothetical protein
MRYVLVMAMMLGAAGCDPQSSDAVPGWASQYCAGADHIQRGLSQDGTESIDCVWFCGDMGAGDGRYEIHLVRELTCRDGL